MIIIDTSVLVGFLRGKASRQIEALIRLEESNSEYFIPAICCQELLQGARDEREWRKLHGYLASQNILVPRDGVALHIEAARIYFECRRRGITLSSTLDCCIAQLALERQAALLHDDRDFERIAQVRPLKQLEI